MILAAAVNPEMADRTADEIVRLKQGDPEAITEVLSRHQQGLYRFLLRMVQNPALADDLYQQTWLRVMEKIGTYDARSRFDTWLYRVAHNLAIDHLRRKSGQSLDEPDESGKTAADRLTSGRPDPLDQLLESERGAILSTALHGLPAIHREILSLRFEDGMKLEQIAEVSSVPLSTVKSRLSRALESLRDAVERRMGGTR